MKQMDGIVLMNDPESDDDDLRGTVTVILDNGFSVDFWLLGLTEEEYLKRTNEIYKAENP